MIGGGEKPRTLPLLDAGHELSGVLYEGQRELEAVVGEAGSTVDDESLADLDVRRSGPVAADRGEEPGRAHGPAPWRDGRSRREWSGRELRMDGRKTPLRDVAIVAGHELADALRSRRVLTFALLFVGGAVAGTLVFVELLESMEATVAHALALSGGGKPGAVTQELMRSDQFIDALTNLVGDERLARELSGLPPLALFYGWIGLAALPMLIMLTASDCISSELANGALRFSLLRTARLSFSAGKLLGQMLLVLVGIASGAFAVLITGYFALANFEVGRNALWLSLLSLRIAWYAFAYVGIGVGISHLTRTVPLARGLALASLLVFSLISNVLRHVRWVREHAAASADAVLQLIPRTHLLDLWRPSFYERLPSIAMLTALGILYFALGFAFRARRDA